MPGHLVLSCSSSFSPQCECLESNLTYFRSLKLKLTEQRSTEPDKERYLQSIKATKLLFPVFSDNF